MAVFGFCEAYDCWFIVGVKDSVGVKYGVVHSSCVKCHGFYGWVSIGFVGVSLSGVFLFLFRVVLGGLWYCVGSLLIWSGLEVVGRCGRFCRSGAVGSHALH